LSPAEAPFNLSVSLSALFGFWNVPVSSNRWNFPGALPWVFRYSVNLPVLPVDGDGEVGPFSLLVLTANPKFAKIAVIETEFQSKLEWSQVSFSGNRRVHLIPLTKSKEEGKYALLWRL